MFDLEWDVRAKDDSEALLSAEQAELYLAKQGDQFPLYSSDFLRIPGMRLTV